MHGQMQRTKKRGTFLGPALCMRTTLVLPALLFATAGCVSKSKYLDATSTADRLRADSVRFVGDVPLQKVVINADARTLTNETGHPEGR